MFADNIYCKILIMIKGTKTFVFVMRIYIYKNMLPLSCDVTSDPGWKIDRPWLDTCLKRCVSLSVS